MTKYADASMPLLHLHLEVSLQFHLKKPSNSTHNGALNGNLEPPRKCFTGQYYPARSLLRRC